MAAIQNGVPTADAVWCTSYANYIMGWGCDIAKRPLQRLSSTDGQDSFMFSVAKFPRLFQS